MKRSFIAGMLLLLMGAGAGAAELPQYAPENHLGVATCASGVCHGSVRPRTTTPVLQNEYVVWSRLDRHRNAYNVLLNEESRQIARKLGLKNAHEASICLDCHADNVPVEKRGARFQLSDGIGCEGCHGGAEKYLTSHTDPNQTHADNVANGLFPADRIEARAELCFSCHIGNDQKIASHEIMGAGHPRLGFELDTFGVLQPAHYVVDDDYRERNKWSAGSATIWALGQVEAAHQTLRLIETHLNKKQRFPELSLFDCHACHHPMSDVKWQQQSRVNLPPGAVRLNDAGFVMLFAIAAAVAPEHENALHNGLKNLHRAVNANGSADGQISALRSTINSLKDSAVDAGSRSESILQNVVKMGGEGKFRDYVAAEQAVMAVDLLITTTGGRDKHSDWLDQLYTAVENEDSYNPSRLRRVMRERRF